MERKNRGILKNKLFLYLTEFFSGMSVMAVELGASRLLAPYFIARPENNAKKAVLQGANYKERI